jgi:glutamate synthase (NADPH/NADH) small chain
MMNACVETTRPFGVKTMVSLNAIMVDGTGMCGSCRVTVGDEVKFACVDGPDFDGHQVDFPELMAAPDAASRSESAATADYAHVCNVEKLLFEQGKRNYKKYKDLAPHQTKMPERDAAERARNFDEVNLGYSLLRRAERGRALHQCSKPTCIAGCPVAIDIPRFIRHLLVRDVDGALAVINESSMFPSVCGRVCPQESQCEAQCVIGRKIEPVAIGRLERFVGDHARPKAPEAVAEARRLGGWRWWARARPGSRARPTWCAPVSRSPSYEALHVVGGVLRYGIPSFRLPREIIEREVAGLPRWA